MSDNGKSTQLQRAQWEARMNYRRREYSPVDKFFRNPVVLVASLTGLLACFCAVVFSLFRAAGWL